MITIHEFHDAVDAVQGANDYKINLNHTMAAADDQPATSHDLFTNYLNQLCPVVSQSRSSSLSVRDKRIFLAFFHRRTTNSNCAILRPNQGVPKAESH